jgi:hypothetical protein
MPRRLRDGVREQGIDFAGRICGPHEKTKGHE